MCTILIIDDRDTQYIAGELPKALAAVGLSVGETTILQAIDYAHAKTLLQDNSVDVVLLDQNFDNSQCQLLDDKLNPARYPVPFQNEQGFLIAQKIALQEGFLRPAILIFTSMGGEIDQAYLGVQEGWLDYYQAKPALYGLGDPEFKQLVDFLRWQLNPLGAVTASGISFDAVFSRFIALKIQDWRKDSPAILKSLLEVAEQDNYGVLNFKAWHLANQAQRLPDFTPAWDAPYLWERLLQPLGRGYTAWQPWNLQANRAPLSRVRHFMSNDNAAPNQSKKRLIMLLDPRQLPEYSASQRKEIENRIAVYDAATPGFRPFRLMLPRNCPASGSPWLIGCWYDLDPQHDWIPLADYREQVIASGQSLRPELVHVSNAVNQGYVRANNTETRARGLLTDAVLINRGERGNGAFDSWRMPLLPLNILGLHPDPTQSKPLSYFHLGVLDTLGKWSIVLTHWFAWGRIPLANTSEQLLEIKQQITDMLGNRPVVIEIKNWWREVSTSPRQQLLFSAQNRCLSDTPTQRVLRVEHKVALQNAQLICEATATCATTATGGVLPLFEQLHFTKSVSLKDCQIVDPDHQPSVLTLRYCYFEAGLDISGLEAESVVVEHCQFGGSGLRFVNSKLPGTLRINDIAITTGSLNISLVQAQNLHITTRQLDAVLGPNLVIDDAIKLEITESGNTKLQNSRVAGDLKVVLANSSIHFEMIYCRIEQNASFDLRALAKAVIVDHCKVAGEVKLDALPIKQHEDMRTEVSFKSCQMGQSLTAAGALNLALEGGQIGCDFIAKKSLGSLSLNDVNIDKEITLSGIQMYGSFTMRRGSIGKIFRAEHTHFQAFTMQASICVGNFLLAHSEFHGPLCIAQPAVVQETPDLTGVAFREQLDFSHVTFHGAADFSHTVVDHIAKFQNAVFKSEADFSGIQAGNNLIFNDAVFHNQAAFDQMLIQGVLDMQQVTFHTQPSFAESSFERPVRLNDVRWTPVDGKPTVDFRSCVFNSLLDLSNPLDQQCQPLPDRSSLFGSNPLFWVNLSDASTNRIRLDTAYMELSLTAQEQQLRHLQKAEIKQARHRLMGMARLFETSLLREMRFDQADTFYRYAANANHHSLYSKLMDWLWGHGTKPLRVLPWMGGIALIMAILSYIAGFETGQPLGVVVRQLLETFTQVLLVQLPEFDSAVAEKAAQTELPLWYMVATAVLVFCQLILSNLFFAAFARKLLR